MSMKMEDGIKRWSAKRKITLVLELIQGKSTVHEGTGLWARILRCPDEPHAYAAGEAYLPESMEEPGWYQPVPRGLESKIAEKLALLRK